MLGTERSGDRRRTLAQRSFAPLIGVLLLGAGCGPAGSTNDTGVVVDVTFEPMARVGATTCSVRLVDPSGAPVAGADVAVEGNMNHAGMVPVFVDPTEHEPGVYTAPFEFTMGGDWFMVVSAELADGRTLEETIEVRGVTAPEGGGMHDMDGMHGMEGMHDMDGADHSMDDAAGSGSGHGDEAMDGSMPAGAHDSGHSG